MKVSVLVAIHRKDLERVAGVMAGIAGLRLLPSPSPCREYADLRGSVDDLERRLDTAAEVLGLNEEVCGTAAESDSARTAHSGAAAPPTPLIASVDAALTALEPILSELQARLRRCRSELDRLEDAARTSRRLGDSTVFELCDARYLAVSLAVVPARQWRRFELPVSRTPALYAALQSQSGDILVLSATTPEYEAHTQKTMEFLRSTFLEMPCDYSAEDVPTAIAKRRDAKNFALRRVERDIAATAGRWRRRIAECSAQLALARRTIDVLSAFESVNEGRSARFEATIDGVTALRERAKNQTTEAYTVWSIPIRG